jgi:uncharacterized membrane protein YraQ (UPF0718 family)
VDDVRNFVINFMAVFFEAMPFIVLGAVIAGVLEEMVPQQLIARFIPRNKLLAISLGALLGLVFPMCECGIVPVMRRLLRKGVPLSSCVAYMLAGPIINVVVILSTTVAFRQHISGMYIVYLRIGLGFLVAVGTGLVVDWMEKKHGIETLLKVSALPPPTTKTVPLGLVNEKDQDEPEVVKRKPVMQRIGNITETALHDFVDITVFLALGAVMAALTRIYLDPGDIAGLSGRYPLLAILVMMALAVVMCLCSEADAFVAASFTTLHPSAKVAFLVLGPMLDFKLLMMFTRVYRPKLIITIVICLLVQVLLYSLAVHYIWDWLQIPRAMTIS